MMEPLPFLLQSKEKCDNIFGHGIRSRLVVTRFLLSNLQPGWTVLLRGGFCEGSDPRKGFLPGRSLLH
jgi:hypothetical protein